MWHRVRATQEARRQQGSGPLQSSLFPSEVWLDSVVQLLKFWGLFGGHLALTRVSAHGLHP